MAETTASVTPRPDVDIRQDIADIIVRYPPLNAERHLIETYVQNGVVRFTGYTANNINRGYLLQHARNVPGVLNIDADDLHDQEAMRIYVGRLLPEGVQANVRYGSVVLSGRPMDTSVDIADVAQQVANAPGVKKVVVS